MPEFQFLVTVAADIDIPPGDDRTVARYAEAALNATGDLPDAGRLDGFADLTGEAWLVDVSPA